MLTKSPIFTLHRYQLLSPMLFVICWRSVAHLLSVVVPSSPLGVVAMRFMIAMFFPKRSFSSFSSCSFFFLAPGLLFKMTKLLCSPEALLSDGLDAAISGRASARDSRVVMSFFEGRRRFLDDLVFVFSILDRNMDDLMARLSFLEAVNSDCDVL